jgi:hypothetical protein
MPAQAPLTHVVFEQGTPVPNCPFVPHVCTPLALSHCVCVGPQAPPQELTPPLVRHVRFTAQGTVPKCPVPSQVWSELPEHCVAPGVHMPLHPPLTHAEFMHVMLGTKAPVESQVSTVTLSRHCV